jgi:ArsR family transcriptional regulator, arsenate/arsenite/antimonite-responsive transcriptional repressor
MRPPRTHYVHPRCALPSKPRLLVLTVPSAESSLSTSSRNIETGALRVKTAIQLTQEQADAAFKALASPHRREILGMLSSASEPGKTCCAPDEVCGCKVSERLGLSPSTVSFHMSALVKGGLVSGRKDGLWTYYTLRRDVLDALCGEIANL